MKIGAFDSGIGGTTIMNEVKKLLPYEDYYYIADSKNCPYGNKSDDELRKIVTKNVEELRKWGAQIIIIACNTATTRCINFLRQTYPNIKFIGTEPAIKLAASTDAKNILVMATPGTIASERTKSLLKENQKPDQNRLGRLPEKTGHRHQRPERPGNQGRTGSPGKPHQENGRNRLPSRCVPPGGDLHG